MALPASEPRTQKLYSQVYVPAHFSILTVSMDAQHIQCWLLVNVVSTVCDLHLQLLV
jgi:hypothetical protein